MSALGRICGSVTHLSVSATNLRKSNSLTRFVYPMPNSNLKMGALNVAQRALGTFDMKERLERMHHQVNFKLETHPSEAARQLQNGVSGERTYVPYATTGSYRLKCPQAVDVLQAAHSLEHESSKILYTVPSVTIIDKEGNKVYISATPDRPLVSARKIQTYINEGLTFNP